MRNNEVLQFFNIITDFIASGGGGTTTKAGRKKRKKKTKNLIKIQNPLFKNALNFPSFKVKD